jgi:hypothetical protein
MLDVFLRSAEGFGPTAEVLTEVLAAVVLVLLAYLGIALIAVLVTSDRQRAAQRYKVFRDILDFFRRSGR